MSSSMGVITLAYLTLALPVVTLCYPDQWLHQIYVDNQTGVNNSSCWEGGYSTPCLSLNLALTGAQHHYNHSTAIILQPGQHQLHSGSETQLRNMNQLAIVGNGSQGEVIIRCESLAGLAFLGSQDIELRNLNLVKCGAIQNSTSKLGEYSYSFLQIQVAVLFLNCEAVQLTNTHVTMSNGTGAVVYNPVGVVNITSCLFSHNGVSGEQEAMYGGGGLVIEVNDVNSQSSCIITNSTFTHNTASSGQYSYLSPSINPSSQYGLSSGGGISVVFRGGAVNNIVQLNIVTIEMNKAQYGGGFFISFFENATNNTVAIDDVVVIGNEALVNVSYADTKGGGAFIKYAASDYQCPLKNSITITSSKFIANEADTYNGGGGIAVDLECKSDGCPSAGNKLLIENCLFENNSPIQRSSFFLSQNGTCIPALLDTTLCCCSTWPGYGVPVNYPTLGCVECIANWYDWVTFIFLQLVLLWIMMILLAVLHINITNGGLNGYILYSQLVSLQFPGLGYSSWVPTALPVYVVYIPLILYNPLIIVYSIWNLNFLTLYPIPVCLPLVDTAAGVILLQYVIAACPLVFIIVTYTWIRWYNNGYRFVVYTTRPVHQLLARFWQKFKIQPSLIDTYAGLILLSYMKFLSVSVKLLQYTAIELQTKALDNTLEHVVLGIVAVLCLLVFVVPPMVVLLFYHLKIFQQCLTWCKLDRPGLHALVDAYQGCFKNSATDDIEARYFAGLYLLFRFCYLVLIVLPSSIHAMYSDNNDNTYAIINGLDIHLEYIPLSVSEACLSFVMAGLVVIMRPYKKIAHNVIDFLILFFLTVIGASSFMGFVARILTTLPIYLPFVFLIFYLIFRSHCCCACVALRRGYARQAIPDGNEGDRSFPTERQPLLKPPTTSVVTLKDHDEDDGYADRMINPKRYNKEDTL